MTDEQLRELRVALKREALLEYAAAVRKHNINAMWSGKEIAEDVEDWANWTEYREAHDPDSKG